ncbi:MAG: PKD domain-containing protein [Patescibacteria group bacterium]
MTKMRSLVFSLSVFVSMYALMAPVDTWAAEFQYDLGVRAEDISFLPSQLISGRRVRIYATVYNFGSEDMTGYVTFFQGAQLVGDSQVISVRANGFADEVFVDFVVPMGPFNIMAAIRGTNPVDQNAVNNEALTSLFTPVTDSDSDGIQDNGDNCQLVVNPDQKDNDGDGLGDLCDPDDDNDGLGDTDEVRLGTSSTNPDTDGDGLADGKDAQPLKKPVSPTSPVTVPAHEAGKPVAKTPPASPTKAPVSLGIFADPSTIEDEKYDTAPFQAATSELALRIVSANFERRAWNSFAFTAEAVGGSGDTKVEWDFGDGGTDVGTRVIHTYRHTGDYTVKAKATDSIGGESLAEFRVPISFFSFSNPKFWVMLGMLTAVAGSLIVVSWKPKKDGGYGDDVV